MTLDDDVRSSEKSFRDDGVDVSDEQEKAPSSTCEGVGAGAGGQARELMEWDEAGSASDRFASVAFC